jgi:hypothetical protein
LPEIVVSSGCVDGNVDGVVGVGVDDIDVGVNVAVVKYVGGGSVGEGDVIGCAVVDVGESVLMEGAEVGLGMEGAYAARVRSCELVPSSSCSE